MRTLVESRVADVAETARLFARRGYVMRASELAHWCAGGSVPASAVERAARESPELSLVDGCVVPAGAEALLRESSARQSVHEDDAARWANVARDYTTSLMRHCPWVRAVLLSGSMASGGFREGDDIDVSLVTEDGAKHLTYVTAVALALPFAWRHRHRVSREPKTPFFPKLFCINVVWTLGEARPFARSDDAMALEVALSRPLMGAEAWRDVLDANPGILSRFPQALAQRPVADVRAAPSRAARLAGALTARPGVRRALDESAFLATSALHAFLRWSRRNDEPARRHVDAMEALKHPYGILDRPGGDAS